MMFSVHFFEFLLIKVYSASFLFRFVGIADATNLSRIQELENLNVKINNLLPEFVLKANLAEIDKNLASCGEVKDIRELTILQIQHYFDTGALTSVQLTKCYRKRITQMNPHLNAVIELNADALISAARADTLRRWNLPRGDLQGIPILIKDNIATIDSTDTCSGSLALIGHRPQRESTLVSFLRKAGAVILGKANLSEFAHFRGVPIPNGWSGRGGQTRNCYNLTKNPSGSSSGSGVAAGANLCAAAIGTETHGSIVDPAEAAGIVGFKPTLKMVPGDGIIPVAGISQDVAGPMTRTVEDAVVIMNVIAGIKFQIAYSRSYYAKRQGHYRVGVFRKPFWRTKVGDTAGIQSIAVLKEALTKFGLSCHVTVVDPIEDSRDLVKKVIVENEMITMLHEAKDGINKYLQTVTCKKEKDSNSSPKNCRMKTLADIIKFNNEHPVPEKYNQNLLVLAEKTDGIQNETYIAITKHNVYAARTMIDSLLDKYRLDALVAPVTSFDSYPLMEYGAIAGYPYLTVPAGFANGGTLPVGILFVGRHNSDKILLKIGAIFEDRNNARKPPSFLP